jgi:arginase family enzyme
MLRIMHLQILDLDGSVTAQPSLREAAAWASIAEIPLDDLASRLRLWSRDATMQLVRARLASSVQSNEPAITMLGSGDFHHLAVLLLERVGEPVTLLHFDNHPDWVRWAPRWHCGSWVNQALKLPQVAKVVTIGPCSDDLLRPQLKGGNLPALAAGRIALFPWRHAPSRVWGRIGDGAGHRHENGYLVWRNLADASLQENIEIIMAQIPTNAVWLSIDKDVLAESEALTNWDQGQMPLQAILDMIDAVGRRKRIIGADICGEYSAPAFNNIFKRIESRMDRPQRSSDAQRLAQNEQVNCRLLRTIEGAAARVPP